MDMATTVVTMMGDMAMNVTMGTDMSDMDMDSDDMNMDMNMVFNFDLDFDLLFNGWNIVEPWQMVLSFIGIFIVAGAYEGLKVLREVLLRNSATVQQSRSILMRDSNGGSSTTQMLETFTEGRVHFCQGMHFLQTLLHVIQISTSYLLMLVVMTYNVYLCMAVVLGAGTGYLVFGWRKAIIVDMNEHCH